jgi:hypothetical protein
MRVAMRLKLDTDSKTSAKHHQTPNQNNGWVMAESSLDKTNINNLNQNEKHMTSGLYFLAEFLG